MHNLWGRFFEKKILGTVRMPVLVWLANLFLLGTKEGRARFFSVVSSATIKGSGDKLKEEVLSDQQEALQCCAVTEPWHSLLREAVQPLPWRSPKAS